MALTITPLAAVTLFLETAGEPGLAPHLGVTVITHSGSVLRARTVGVVEILPTVYHLPLATLVTGGAPAPVSSAGQPHIARWSFDTADLRAPIEEIIVEAVPPVSAADTPAEGGVYEVGDQAVAQYTFRNAARDPADPTSVITRVRRPDGTTSVLSNSSPQTGVYRALVAFTVPGIWHVTFDANGQVEDSYSVRYVVEVDPTL